METVILRNTDWFHPRDNKSAVEECLSFLNPELEIERQINKGGFGTVYRLKRGQGIVKFIDTSVKNKKGRYIYDKAAVKYLHNEVRVMELLRSCPYVVHLHKASIISNPHNLQECRFLLWMEELVPVTSFLARHSITEKMALRLLGDIAQALNTADRQGIAHQDVKLANCFLRFERNGDDVYPRFVLGDWGAAVFVSQAEPEVDGQCVGTNGFIAPEKLAVLSGTEDERRAERLKRKKAFHQGDIYSLCASLFTLLTGRIYISGASRSVNEVSPYFAKLIAKGCERSLKSRYHHAYELCNELRDVRRNCKDHVLLENGFLYQAQKMYIDGTPLTLIRSLLEKGKKNQIEGCKRFQVYLDRMEAERQLNEAHLRMDKSKERLALHKMGEAEDDIKKLVQRGDAIAEGILGFWLFETQPTVGLSHIRSAAKGGWAVAQYFVGMRLWEQGELQRGADELLKAAVQGYPLAMKRFAQSEGDRMGPYRYLSSSWKRRVSSGAFQRLRETDEKSLEKENILWL